MKNRHAYLITGAVLWIGGLNLHDPAAMVFLSSIGGMLVGSGVVKCWMERDV